MFSCGRREDIPDERHREKNERDDLENNKNADKLKTKEKPLPASKGRFTFPDDIQRARQEKNQSHEKHSIASKTLYCHALTLRVRGPAQPLRCRKTFKMRNRRQVDIRKRKIFLHGIPRRHFL